MQRKDIDSLAFDDLRSAMVEADTTEGSIMVVTGRHPLHGALILVAAAGSHAVLGNDVHLVVGEGETLETEMAAA